MNRADRMLEALRDGESHSRAELFRDAGRFYLTNNAASELRARGHVVEQFRKGDEFFYQLTSLQPAAARPEIASSSVAADWSEDGLTADDPSLLLTAGPGISPEGPGAAVSEPLQLTLESEAA